MKYTNWALKSYKAEVHEVDVLNFTGVPVLPVFVQRTQNWARDGEVEIDVSIKSKPTGKYMRLTMSEAEALALAAELIKYGTPKNS